MTDQNKSRYGWKMWLVIAAALAVLLAFVLLFYAPLRGPTPDEAPAQPSTEWTTAPEEPAVQVDLPDTPVRNVPRATPSAEDLPE